MNEQSIPPIAIVGIGCRFPAGANDPEKLWSVLSEGRGTWSDVPDDRWNWKSFFHPSTGVSGTINSRGGHFIDGNVRAFDASFFGIPPAEANAMDPQHRIQLESAYEALENAGITLEEIAGSQTSVYIALFNRDYDRMMFKDTNNIATYHLIGSGDAVLSNRISYTFDLKGPSMTLDTGCSGSLVALHQACQGLRGGEADMALVGGTSLMLSPDTMIPMSLLNILNREGKCFVFDDRGSGYGRGEGVATVVLKRLDDALKAGDHIRGIIRNTGVNQDGKTSGIAMPNQDAQQALVSQVYKRIGLDPHDVSYVEAHGTGTVVGDLAETNSVAKVFCSDTRRKKPLFIGSVKANIGHLESASGVAGLIKAILILEKRLIPPHINLENWKKDLKLESSNIKVPNTLLPLPVDESGKALVSINSFGYGGTNSHVILETDPVYLNLANGANGIHKTSFEVPVVDGLAHRTYPKLFSLTARSKESLVRMFENLQNWALKRDCKDESGDLNNLAHTLNSRRSVFQWRLTFTAATFQELSSHKPPKISRAGNSLRIAFVFTGQGAQWVAMGRELLQTNSEFRRSLERSERILQELGASWSLIEELLRLKFSRINQSEIAQPATTALQIALVDLLKAAKITPSIVLGHSSGEITGAYAAGILSQSMALKVSFYRSFLSTFYRSCSATKGAMLAVGLGENDVLPLIRQIKQGRVSIACVNSHLSTTVSGDEVAILELQHLLESQSIFARKLNVDTAYHSYHMEMVAERYLQSLAGLEYNDPNPAVTFISSVTAEQKDSSFGPSYWVENLVSKVRFSDGLQILSEQFSSKHVLIEIGPHSALAGPVRQTMANLGRDSDLIYLPALVRNQDAIHCIFDLAGKLFVQGYQPDLQQVNKLCGPVQSTKVLTDLPPYPWNHSNLFWHESRLSQELRFRAHPYHDLLGVRILGGTPWRPIWRNVFSINTLPWLSDHVVDGFIIFPGSGYLCMAIEAMRQLAEDRELQDLETVRFVLRNIAFSKSLIIPQPPQQIETQISLTPSRAGNESVLMEWKEFEVSSFQDGMWKQHCSGSIRVESISSVDEIDEVREATLTANSQRESFQDLRQKRSETVDSVELYDGLRSHGNMYGSNFAAIRQFQIGDFHAVATVVTPDVAATMPSRFMQPHIIHPTTLDAIFQTSLPIHFQHCAAGSVMPTSMDEIIISAAVCSKPGRELFVGTELQPTGPRSATMSSIAFQEDELSNMIPVVVLSKGELKGLGDTTKSGFDNKVSRNFTYRMEWNIDIDFSTGKSFQCFSPTKEREPRFKDRVELLNTAASLYIKQFLGTHNVESLSPAKKHYDLLFKWMNRYVESEQCRSLISGISELDIPTVLSRVPQAGVEGEFLHRMCGNMTQIMSGHVDPLSLMLEGDLLQQYYSNDTLVECASHLISYLRLLAFKKPNLALLEVGAGTGGTTMPVLQALGSGSSFGKYDYTDISSGFFEMARAKFRDWSDLLTFKSLNIENDPIEQGFEEASYDVIIASNVLHATKCMEETLRNVRRLLKPTGKLLLIEPTHVYASDNMRFGFLPGWWAGIDDGRHDSPILSLEMWKNALNRTSFNGVELVARDFEGPANWCDFMATSCLPQEKIKTPMVNILHSRIAKAKLGRFSEDLLSELQQKQVTATFSDWPAEKEKVDSTCLYIIIDSSKQPLLSNPEEEEFEKITALAIGSTKILCISILEDDDDTLNAESALISGFARVARTENALLRFVTLDIQQTIPRIHQDSISEVIFDIVSAFATSHESSKFNELEYTYYDNRLHIPRLIPDSKLNDFVTSNKAAVDSERDLGPFQQLQRPLKLHVESPGLLDTLTFIDNDRYDESLGEDEVEIQVKACGVNFKDVFIALGQMKATDLMVGECAGIVNSVGSNFADKFRPGDRVWALVAIPAFANLSRTKGSAVYKIPQQMPYTTAASIPVVFTTAYYGLVSIANLRRGQTVLVHAASGGVGQAAIMIAQDIGAEIFATVGSTSKSQLLIEKYNIPKSHIFSSRTRTFRAGIQRLTKGRGVDVVLNSLSGDALQESWHCVAPMGVFVEIGKTDIYRKGQLSMEPFEKNITFASVDLSLQVIHRPENLQPIFTKIMDKFESGAFQPVYPVTIMPISDIEKAFRLIQARKHIGKVVLDADNTSLVTINRPPRKPLSLKGDKTYIIVGGLGALGHVICKFMVSRGAKHLVILSRRNKETQEARTFISEVEALGGKLEVVSCDISDISNLRQAMTGIHNSMPPICGVIQAAMVLKDFTLENMSAADFKKALNPKVAGTKNLLSALETTPLEFFIMLSSCATLLGSGSQANYSSACSFQDMTANFKSRTSSDTRTISLNLGWIEGSKSVHDAISERAFNSLQQSGITVTVSQLLALLESCMGPDDGQNRYVQLAIGFDKDSNAVRKAHNSSIFSHLPNLVGNDGSTPGKQIAESFDKEISKSKDLEEVYRIVTTAIARKLCALVACDFNDINLESPIINLGLDSLIAIELKNWINRTLHAALQTSEILDSPSLLLLGRKASERSVLVTTYQDLSSKNQQTNGHTETNLLAMSKGPPPIPLPELKDTLQLYETSVKALLSEEERESLCVAIQEFQQPGSIGQTLQSRLLERKRDPNLDCWLYDLYNDHVYLQKRYPITPYGNFMEVHSVGTFQHAQAERAAIVTLAALHFKERLETNNVEPDLLNEQPLCKNGFHFLFNTVRKPQVGVDRMQKSPNKNHISVLSGGHIYKIEASVANEKMPHASLKNAFQKILDRTFGGKGRSIAALTSDQRDRWAETYDSMKASDRQISSIIDMVETSAFVICLDDGSPQTATDRSNQFLLGDISNRWSDKTLQFAVCTNGESATILEHSMIDALTGSQLSQAITAAVLAHRPETHPEFQVKSNKFHDQVVVEEYEFSITPETESHIEAAEKLFQDLVRPSETINYIGNHFGNILLRSQKVTPKTGYQLIIQLASLIYFGYQPSSWQTISMAPFNKGRVELIQAILPEVAAFTRAALEQQMSVTELREMFLRAARVYTSTLTQISRGRGFATHLYALQQVLQNGEAAPSLFNLPLYSNIRPGKMMTDNADRKGLIREMAFAMPDPENVLIHYEVLEHTCNFVIVAPLGQSSKFFEAIERATMIVKEFLTDL